MKTQQGRVKSTKKLTALYVVQVQTTTTPVTIHQKSASSGEGVLKKQSLGTGFQPWQQFHRNAGTSCATQLGYVLFGQVPCQGVESICPPP